MVTSKRRSTRFAFAFDRICQPGPPLIWLRRNRSLASSQGPPVAPTLAGIPGVGVPGW